MRNILILALLSLAPSVQAAYIQTIFQDPKHPYLSASALYTPRFEFDGAETDVAVVYHKADPHDTLWPQRLIDAGVPALSWQPLELGAGGDKRTAFGVAGASIDIAQTILGPLASVLKASGGNYVVAANLLASPDGAGLKIGYGAKTLFVENGGFVALRDLRVVGRWKLGYIYHF